MLTLALAAAVISLFITPPGKELLSDIDWRTLGTLFMMLTVLEGFKQENIFRPFIRFAGRFTRMRGLSFFLICCVFFSSMFVTNDVSLIIFVPLTIMLFRAGGKERYILPVITMENIAAIRGSLLTPFGSPQNLYLYGRSGVSAAEFVLHMSPLWITSFFLLYLFVWFLYRKDPKEAAYTEAADERISKERSAEGNTAAAGSSSGGADAEAKPAGGQSRLRKIIYICLFVFVIVNIVTRNPYWYWSVALVAVIVLIFDRRILLKTDYVLLLTFLCFFVFSSSIASNEAISGFMTRIVKGREYWVSILLSQVISNVPASIVLWPFTDNLAALLYGLDSAGLCSLIGSLASVINYRIYVREYPGGGRRFIKVFTLISLAFFAIVALPFWWLSSVWRF